MDKIKNSFSGVIIGILLIIGGTIMLWWNEGETVKNLHSVEEMSKTAIQVKSDEVNPKNDGKLVATNGKFEVVDEKLSDDQFKIEKKTAKLVRTVECYAWVETEHTDDDVTTYSYEKKWVVAGEVPDSDAFHETGHVNPKSWGTIPSDEQVASEVKVGAFKLSTSQVSSVPANVRFNIDGVEAKEGYTNAENYMTTSKDVANPEVGDTRISWHYNDWTEASILAKQNGDSFIDWTSKEGRTVNRVENGIMDLDALLNKIKGEDKATKWIFRLIGALLVIFGYMALINPITTLTSFVPILGGIVGGILGLIAFLIGLIHSLVVIVISWFAFRPILAAVILAVIVALVILIVMLIKKNKKPATVQAG